MVMSDKNLPANVSNRAVAAARDDELAQRLAQMRGEVAMAEQRIITYVCAKTGGRFFARFGRDTPKGKFTIKAIEKGAPGKSGGLPGGLFSRSAPAAQAYAAKEFDRTGWHCPYCDVRGGSIYCDECGENVCAGRTRRQPSGEELFVCHDGCGATGGLVSTDKIRGSSGATCADARALESPARLALPEITRKLEGPKK
jgi:hypothetical protein